MKKYLLFDLDGTLTDPKIGICTCVQYALASLGIEEPDLDKLEPFIGPPLKSSFMEFYQLDEARAEAAIGKYRERFQDKGIFENSPYEGIHRMLRNLKAKGMVLAVASSKPTVFVKQILEHYKMDKYFTVVMGSELDGRRGSKEEVVHAALRALFGNKPIERDAVYMIGDRRFDVEGAHAARVESVGVTYGYGSMEELKAARSDYIVRSVEELESFLLRGTDGQDQRIGFGKIWRVVFPFLLFFLVRQAVEGIGGFLLAALWSRLPGGDFWIVRDGEGMPIGFTGNAIAIVSALGFAVGGGVLFPMAKRAIRARWQDSKLLHLKGDPGKCYVLMGVAIVGAAFGLNLLISLLGLIEESEAYRQVAASQYAAWLPVGLICYGVIAPIAEELLFRGIVYHELRGFLKMSSSMVISAALFAMYHGNSVQGIYAFLIGMLMVYAYEYFGDFKVAVAIHMAANLLVYLVSSVGAADILMNWPVCVLCVTGAVVSVYFLNREKKIF